MLRGHGKIVPDANHVVVHPLQLALGHLNGVGRGVKFVGLEALIAKGNRKRLVVGLDGRNLVSKHSS